MESSNNQRKIPRVELLLAVLAFVGIGIELPLAFFIEPMIYGVEMNSWTTLHSILHWILTCVTWCGISLLLTTYAKKKIAFDIWRSTAPITLKRWGIIAVLFLLSLVISYFDWNGSKVVKEFVANGWLKFIFQYIYYFFECILIMLIIGFSQEAIEHWLPNKNIPYGGIVLALTWGVGHFVTKDYLAGGLCMVSALMYGSIYLLTNKNGRKFFLLLYLMFVL